MFPPPNSTYSSLTIEGVQPVVSGCLPHAENPLPPALPANKTHSYPGGGSRCTSAAAFAVIATLWLAGCAAGTPEHLPTPIEGYNHTSAAINRFTVNGAGGPNIGPHQGGGKQNCCVSLPTRWRPGLKVVIEWEKDPNVGASRYWKERPFSEVWNARMKEHESHYTRHRAVVELEPYGDFGSLDVHFFPCDVVRVSTSNSIYGQPGYRHNEPLTMKEPATCPHP